MKTDKNTVIGFVLLGVLLFFYFWYTSQQNQAIIQLKKKEEDSLAKVAAARIKLQDTVAAKLDSLKRDTADKKAAAGNFTEAALGTETLQVIENDLMKVTFTNKGAQIKSVELKNYKDGNGKQVVLADKKDRKSVV